MQFRNPLLVIAVVLAFVVAGYAFYPGPETEDSVLPRVGFQASAGRVLGFNLLSDNPPVPGVEMHDEDGRPVTFEKLRGKVVLFNLWATWCPPCKREMPDLNSLHAQYKDRGLVVVPVASGRQGREEPAEFLHKRGLNELITYYDPHSQFLRLFDLETLPVTFLIDRKGLMRGGVIGILDWSSVEAKAMIEELLDEQDI